MLKFPLADCDAIDEWSPRSFQSALAAKQEVYSLFFESCLDTRFQIGLIGVAKIFSFSKDIQVLKNVYFLLSQQETERLSLKLTFKMNHKWIKLFYLP